MLARRGPLTLTGSEVRTIGSGATLMLSNGASAA